MPIGMVLSRVAVGNDTVIDGVGDGCAGAPIATPVSTKNALTIRASSQKVLRLNRGSKRDVSRVSGAIAEIDE